MAVGLTFLDIRGKTADSGISRQIARTFVFATMEDVHALLNKYKLRVKRWEVDFKRIHSRKPSKVGLTAGNRIFLTAHILPA